MANEFKIKKGLIVTGASGGTVVDIQGSQGQLFSVTDDLSGSIFAVSDISGVPIFDVNSSGLSTFDGPLTGTSAQFIDTTNPDGGGGAGEGGSLTIEGRRDGTANLISLRARDASAPTAALPNGQGSLIRWQGFDGTDFAQMGAIAVVADGQAVANSDAPSKMIFYTTPDGSDALTTALTLDKSQNATFASEIIANGNITSQTTGGAGLNLRRDDTSISGTNTLGSIAFQGDDPTDGTFNNGAVIFGKADGSWSSGAYPGQLLLQTRNTTGSLVTALTLAKDQNATFGTQAFATTATSSGDASSTLTTKGYVDSLITGATIYRGAWDPSGGGYGSPDLSGVTQTSGYYYICSAAGTAEPNGTGCEPDSWETGDWVIWNDDIVDCAGTGTGGWQKIDNSSVLSGVGTGQTVALWQGAGSVTDSETLGNAPITVSGNNATFAGTIDSGNIFIDNSGVPQLKITDSGNGGGGGASGKIIYANTAGNAIGLGYTADLTTNSDFIISTDAGSTYGGYLGLTAAAIADPSSIILDPKTYVYATKALGIKIDEPIADLHVNGDVQIGDSTNPNSFGVLQVNQASNADESGIGILSSGKSRSMRIWVDETNSYINSGNGGGGILILNEGAGNVGIGTTSPAAKLDVSSGSTSTFRLSNTDTALTEGQITGAIEFQQSDSTSGGTGVSAAIKTRSSARPDSGIYFGQSADLGFFVSGSSNGAVSAALVEAMTVRAPGNVGIGTTSPGAKLEISHSGSNNGLLLENTLNSSNYQIALNIRENEGLIFQRWTGGVFDGNLMRIGYTGAIKFDAYDSTNNTGTPTYLLGTDASGNIVKTNTVPGSGAGPYLPLSAGSSYPLTGELHVDDRVIIENTTNLTTGVADSLLIKTLSSGTSITNGFGGGLSFYLENTVYSAVNEVGKIAVIETDTIAIDDKMVFSVKDNNILAERLTLTGQEAVFTGNVGIGVTSPGTKLDISVTPSAPWMKLINANETAFNLTTYNNGTNNGSSVYAFKHGLYYNTTENAAVTFYRGGSSVGGFLTFTTNNGTERMRIDSSGNVGIGTDSPSEKLTIQTSFTTSASDSYVEINSGHEASGGSDVTGVAGLLFKQAGSGNVLRNAGSIVSGRESNYSTDNTADSYLTFSTAQNNVNAEKMRIDSSGNVGIGTTDPAKKLHVKESTSATYAAYIENTIAGGDYLAMIGDAGDNVFEFDSGGTGGEAVLKMYSDGVLKNQLVANGTSWINGNVAIGATSSTKKLTVNGSFKLGTNAYIEYGGVYPYTITTANTAAVGNLVFSAGLGSAAYESRIDLQGTNTAGVAGITLSTAATARMVVTADGDVGIGTTTPLAKLDIQGTQGQLFSVTDDLSGSIFAVSDISGVPIFDVNSSGVSYFDGNVGIGETSPTSKLSIKGAQAAIDFQRGTGDSKWEFSSDAARFYIAEMSTGTRDYIVTLEETTGNFGIGTTSPGAKLSLYDATEDVSINVNTGTGGSYPKKTGISFGATSTSLGGDAEFTGGAGIQAINTAASNNVTDLAFWTTTGGSPTERMRIDSAGAIKFNAYGAGTLVTDASGNITVSSGGGVGGPFLPLAGGTMTGDINMENGERIRWTDNPSGGLSIHSNSSNSFIQHTGTGYFQISNDCTGGIQTEMLLTNSARNQAVRFQADNGNPEGTTSCEVRDYFFLDGASATYASGASTAVYTVFPDLSYIALGTGKDLQIYHDGSNSYINDSGTGDLYIQGSDDIYITAANGEKFITCNTNGSVEIRYNNVKQFETTSAGVDVVGLRVDNSGDIGLIVDPGSGTFSIGDISAIADGVHIVGDTTNIYIKENDGSAVNTKVTFTSSGSQTNTGAITATNFILSSDETLKDKIKDIETKHVDVKWKNFELISEPGVKRSGVVAQELEKKHPEFVRTDGKGLKSVAYIDLLIAKIAELEARLEKAGI